MRYREFQYRWEYDLKASPEMLWPFVADTNRFNRDVGLPAILEEPESESRDRAAQVAAAGGSEGGGDDDGLLRGRRRVRFSLKRVRVSWEEEPFEWLRPKRFGVVRRFNSGPLAEMRVQVELTPRDPEGGTRLVYQLSARPRTALGLLAIPAQLGRLGRGRFASTIHRYDELAVRGKKPLEVSDPSSRALTANTRKRLSLLDETLVELGAEPELVGRLIELVERSDDLTLARIRPYELADCWNAPRRAVLELCLQATRAGLLDFRWEVLCPLCRGPQQSSPSLKDLQTNLHCGTCRIDVTANFDRSVEVTFRPNPAIREVASRDFCFGGPQVTPHVVAQQPLAPGQSSTLMPTLETGRYRLRALALPGARSLAVTSDGLQSATLAVDDAGWPGDELLISAAPSLRVENRTGGEQIIILERTAWSDSAATAADVTALQLFRDLFATEALRPGEQISVGSLTVVFTDLSGSTRLYREIGDAVAFGAVMNHFDVLREAIADEGGAIVKTLGDAVMAVFTRPAPALRAVLRAQTRLASPPAGMRPLWLKAGIHTGPCIAVTLDRRLDYFGSNINIAARLEPLSSGHDCIISSAVRRDPRVSAMLSDGGGNLVAEPVETSLKGFDAELFELWRVSVRRRETDGTDESTGTEEAGGAESEPRASAH